VLGLKQRMRTLARNERGAALSAVVGLMAVGVVLTAVVASSVITAQGVTTSVRAGVQSQAAAEAGVAAARNGLVSGTCASTAGRYASVAGAVPEYVATIWTKVSGSWTRGCPANTSVEARILSSGYASSPGVDGQTARDQTNIEVVLTTIPASTTTAPTTPTEVTLVASGPAVYAYNAGGFGGAGKLVSIDGSSPSVLVKTGDVVCSGGSAAQADWVIDGGAFTVNGSCNITGTVWVDKGLTVSGGPSIGGSAVAASINVSGSSKINGSAWATGDVILNGGGTQVGVNVTAGGNLTIGGSAAVKNNTWVQLHTSLDWGTNIAGNAVSRTLSVPQWSSGLVSGSITTTSPNSPGSSPYAAPARPVVADWVDFTYAKSDWVGFTEFVVPAGTNCDYAKLTAIVTGFAGNPGVIDARNCTNTIEVSSYQKLALTNDLAIIANKFNLGGSGGFSSSVDRRLWLINPDTTANKAPTCGANQSFQVGGGFTFDSKLDVMMYSPCRINVGSSTVFTGQVFAGQAVIDGGSQIKFAPVGLPGWNLTTGASTTGGSGTTPPPATTTTYAPESQRAVSTSRIVTEQN
jgi:Tfp pilus assembly protein PilX/cytoskeletal protein CcmA (bactofilin family)